MRLQWALVALGPVLIGSGCGDDDEGAEGAGWPAGQDGDGPRSLVLTDAFDDIAAAFEEADPGRSPRRPTTPGAPTSPARWRRALPPTSSRRRTPRTWTAWSSRATSRPHRCSSSNVIRIAVPAGNPGNVEGLEDFARDELLVGSVPRVPCGVASVRRFWPTPRSRRPKTPTSPMCARCWPRSRPK